MTNTWCCLQPSSARHQGVPLWRWLHHCQSRTSWRQIGACSLWNSVCSLCPSWRVGNEPEPSWTDESSTDPLSQNRRRRHLQFGHLRRQILIQIRCDLLNTTIFTLNIIPRGLMANSGMRWKSSLQRKPLSPLSRLVKRLYSLSIWLGVNPVSCWMAAISSCLNISDEWLPIMIQFYFCLGTNKKNQLI